MVLAGQLIFRHLYPLTLLLCACSYPDAVASDAINVRGWAIKLIEQGDSCMLKVSRGQVVEQFRLAPTAPCRFVGPDAKSIQIEEFVAENRTLFVVFGTPYAGDFNRRQDRYCGTVSQAVAVSPIEIRLSERVAEGGLRCEGEPIDRREFELFNESVTK